LVFKTVFSKQGEVASILPIIYNKHLLMKTLKIALDWTPNVNHIGILIAKELGYYKQHCLDVVIISPRDDNYAVTPGKRLELDDADFAIAPFETAISLNNKINAVDAIAVYAILQEDISSIAVLASSNLTSPKQLDGKIYASFKARYEDKIVKELVKEDGGTGAIEIIYPDKLGIWNTLMDGTAHATWIFDNWEGVEADHKKIALTTWSLKDSGIPYGYSPVILAKKANISHHKTEYAHFTQATKQGYLYAATHPADAVRILKSYLTTYDIENINIEKTLEVTIPYIGTIETCGLMDAQRVDAFLKWLVAKELENKAILTQDLYSNELLGL
jgi:ABC-type nitrate/sulfonate/bicarbonate transport system substrate-binding protein